LQAQASIGSLKPQKSLAPNRNAQTFMHAKSTHNS
jgi:hypothetical protein